MLHLSICLGSWKGNRLNACWEKLKPENLMILTQVLNDNMIHHPDDSIGDIMVVLIYFPT